MSGQIMRPQHLRWTEFVTRLAGPEGCDFREDENGPTWTCLGGDSRQQAVAILRSMGFDDDEILTSLDYFSAHGGYCDCEIVFNVEHAARRPRR